MPEQFEGIALNHNGNIQAYGSVAQRMLANKMNVSALRTNDTLRKDEWIQFDEKLIPIAQQRMNAVGDLLSRGLRHNVPNGMGTTVIEWETVDETRDAEISMDGLTRAQSDTVNYVLQSVPLPITHRDFYINLRTLEASRQRGEALDTTNMELATRKVSERLETTLIAGASAYAFGGGTIRGYLDHPNRNTVSLPLAWDNSGITGELILADVISLINAAHTDRMFGPYVMYVPTLYWIALLEDFKANSDKSIIERLREVPFLEEIKVADFLTADNILMIQMTSDVVDMVVGQGITTVQWETQGGFQVNFKVMALMVPRIKADQDGRSGIIHMS